MGSAEALGIASETARRPVVLVVEDDVLIRSLLCDVLRDEAYTVIEASDPDQALGVLNCATALDVLVTDVRMPGSVDGLELAARARALRPGLKIVVSSGHVGEAEALRRADAFLRKPYDLNGFLAQIRKLTQEADDERS